MPPFSPSSPKLKCAHHIAFAYCKCANQKADKTAEAIALAWKWFVKLQERGKNAATFPGVFAILVARAVASGRRIAGGETRRTTSCRDRLNETWIFGRTTLQFDATHLAIVERTTVQRISES